MELSKDLLEWMESIRIEQDREVLRIIYRGQWRRDMDEWDGIGNSKIFGIRETHPLQEAAMWHDERYNQGDIPRSQVTTGFLKKGWLKAASSLWDGVSAIGVMTVATVIVPVWDLLRYKEQPPEDGSLR